MSIGQRDKAVAQYHDLIIILIGSVQTPPPLLSKPRVRHYLAALFDKSRGVSGDLNW